MTFGESEGRLEKTQNKTDTRDTPRRTHEEIRAAEDMSVSISFDFRSAPDFQTKFNNNLKRPQNLSKEFLRGPPGFSPSEVRRKRPKKMVKSTGLVCLVLFVTVSVAAETRLRDLATQFNDGSLRFFHFSLILFDSIQLMES